MAGRDILLASKAVSQSFLEGTAEDREIFRRINETSPSLRQDAGFYVNPFETILGYLSIPQQVLFQIGKNLGELALQREIGTDSFATDIQNALSGKSRIGFKDILKSFDIDEIDLALPEGYTIDNWATRVPLALLSGAAATFFTGNLAVGLTAGFAMNDILAGKGVISSVADVALDPLNKLRILQRTTKGLGITKNAAKHLQKSGRLEDLVQSGFAYIPKAGSRKATENLFSITLKGSDAKTVSKVLGNAARKIDKDKAGNIIVLTDEIGIDVIKKSTDLKGISNLKQVQKKGQLGGGDLEKIEVNFPASTFIGTLLKGERKLFDFKGNSGFVINQNTPLLGKYLITTPFTSVDLNAPANLVAKAMDAGIDFMGATISSIPKMGKGLENLAKFEEKFVAPILKKAVSPLSFLAKTAQVGGDFGLKSRKLYKDIASDVGHPAHKVIMEKLNKFTGNTVDQKLDSFETHARGIFESAEKYKSSLSTQEASAIQDALDTIKRLPLLTLDNMKSKLVGDVAGNDAIKAIERGFERKLLMTPEEVANLNMDNTNNIPTIIKALEESENIKNNLESFLVQNHIDDSLDDAAILKQVKDVFSRVDPSLIEAGNKLDEIYMPLNFKLSVAEVPEQLRQSLAAGSDVGKTLNVFVNKSQQMHRVLKRRKVTLEKSLNDLDNEFLASREVIDAQKVRLNTAIKNAETDIQISLDNEKALIKFLDNPGAYKKTADDIAIRRGDLKKALGTDKSILAKKVKKTADLTKNKSDTIAVESLNSSLGKMLQLRGKEFLDLSLMTKEERMIHKASLELLGVNNKDKFEFLADNAKALGKLTDDDLIVADVFTRFTPDQANKVVLRMSQTADVRDGANLLAQTVWELLDNAQKNQVAQLFGNESVGKVQTNFMNTFIAGILNPQPLLDNTNRTQSGFFGKLHDTFRSVFSMIGKMFRIPKFKNEELRKKLFTYLQGTDLNVEKLSLKGDEIISVQKLFDTATGKVTDTAQMRAIMDRSRDALVNTGLMAKNGGMDAGLHGAVWQPLVLKNKEAYQEMQQRAKSLSIDIANKGQIGTRELINWQRMFKDNPDLVELVVNEHQLVPENLMKVFLEAKDFTGKANPNTMLTQVISRIANVMEIVPYEAFSNDFGLLYKMQFDTLKNMEAIPVIKFMKDYMDFMDVSDFSKLKKDRVLNTLSRFDLSHRGLGALDNTTIADNEQFAVIMKEMTNYIEHVPGTEWTDRLRNIRSTIDKRKLSPESFALLKKDISDLGNTGNKAEQDVVQQLNGFIADFQEGEKLSLSSLESSIDNIMKEGEGAETLKTLMRTRYEALQSPVAGGQLKKEIENTLTRASHDSNVDEVLTQISDAISDVQISQYASKGAKNFTSLVNSDASISKMRGFSTFSAGTSESPIARSFDGHLVPDSLKPLIQRTPKENVNAFSEVKKVINDFVIGIGEQAAKERGLGTVSGLNNILPEFAQLGTRSEKAFSSLYKNLNYDYLLNLFKSHALMSPAFHARNVMSAFYVNSTHGVDAGSHAKALKAALFQRVTKFQKGIDYDVKLISDPSPLNITSGKRKPTEIEINYKNQQISQADREHIELIEEAKMGGVTGGGRAAEISADINEKNPNRGWFNPLSLDWTPLKYNFAIAGFSEDAVRMAAFKHARDTLSYSIEDAGDFAKLLHFDYNLLTDVERTKFKRVIPFYTYSRKAIARDSRMFVERTGEFVRMGKVINDFEQGVPPEKSDSVSSYIKDNLGVNFKIDDQGRHYYVLLGGLIPSADIAQYMNSGIDIANMEVSEGFRKLVTDFGKQLTPYLKIPIEKTFNWNIYFNKPISTVQGEYADMFGQTIPKTYAYYLNQIRWLRDLDKVFHSALNLKNVVRPDLPSPSETSLGQGKAFIDVLGGVKVLENANPTDINFFQNVLPKKQQLGALKRTIQREARRGGGPNLENAVKQYKILRDTFKDDFVKRNSANNQILRRLENK